MNQKMILEKESYLKLKGQGKSDAEIAKQFGIKQPTLIYYKKKWEKEPSQAAKKAVEATIEKLKQPEPVKVKEEVKPSQTPPQPDTAVVKVPESKPIGTAINEVLNEAVNEKYAEKTAEYERLIAALRSDLNEAHNQLDEKDEKIRNWEQAHVTYVGKAKEEQERLKSQVQHLHAACEDAESEIVLLQKDKKNLEQKLIEEMLKKVTPERDSFNAAVERFSELEKENGILRKLIKKWA